jgi:uncharacterized membrane protein YhaH (DUF805 family)
MGSSLGLGLGGVAVGIGVALTADVLLLVLVGTDRLCSPGISRFLAGLIVASFSGLIVAGVRRLRDSTRSRVALFLTGAGIAGLLGTAPLTVAIFAARLCRA